MQSGNINSQRDGLRDRSHAPNPVLTSLQATRPRSDDSWIEVSSQPSSSSLSSAADEIITTGLRVQPGAALNPRRRPRRPDLQQTYASDRPLSMEGSSQEEYEESESESDRILSSSNEGYRAPVLSQLSRPSALGPYSSTSSENLSAEEPAEYDDDDDENSTAINFPRSRRPGFTPQPNVFTHQSTSQQRPRPQRHSTVSDTYLSTRPPSRPSAQRHSYSSQPQQQHSPYNVMAPSHTADHDAALRASLSTLLSCAAAARGLPKSNQRSLAPTAGSSSNRVDPASLRMVPESVALGDDTEPPSPVFTRAPASSARSKPLPSPTGAADKSKRKASAQPRSSSKDRPSASHQPKKPRHAASPSSSPHHAANAASAAIDDISPTLMTWVLSAGVVVLVTALSFSAGYVVGRETGRAELLGADRAGATGRCAGVVVREVAGGDGGVGGWNGSGSGLAGWRRFRWGSAAVGGVTA